jgi:hypothetical protein
MKIKVILSTVLLVLLGVGVVWAGEPWEDKPYTEWTAEDVNRVLQDSPWVFAALRALPLAPEVTSDAPALDAGFGTGIPLGADSLRFPGSPAGLQTPARGRPRAETVNAAIRWDSSRTIREALARALQLAGQATPDQAAQWLAETPPHNEIFVGGPWLHLVLDKIARPGTTKEAEWPYEGVSQETLKSCHLLVSQPGQDDLKVHPVEAEFVIKSTAAPALVFRFPRMNIGVPSNDDSPSSDVGPTVNFIWNTPKGKLTAVFVLRLMQRDGKPDL